MGDMAEAKYEREASIDQTEKHQNIMEKLTNTIGRSFSSTAEFKVNET